MAKSRTMSKSHKNGAKFKQLPQGVVPSPAAAETDPDSRLQIATKFNTLVITRVKEHSSTQDDHSFNESQVPSAPRLNFGALP